MEIIPEVQLSWNRQDVEQRIGFPGGRFTQVNTWLAGIMGLLLTLAFFGALLPFRNADDSEFVKMFLRRGWVPYAIVLFTSWALSILFLKSRKLAFQRKALNYDIVPQDHTFVLSSATVDDVVDRVFGTVDDPKYFILFNRIVIALSNLRNLGRVADVDDILHTQASQDESSMETSYAVVGGFVWAIPVLGFIGTVLGLSDAIGKFGKVLQDTSELSAMREALRDVTAGLSVAFQTTLQALVAALIIQLIITFLRKSEEEFLDHCGEYCTRNIVNRLRIMPYQHQDSDRSGK